jgi:hypothetical protein
MGVIYVFFRAFKGVLQHYENAALFLQVGSGAARSWHVPVLGRVKVGLLCRALSNDI